MEQEPHPDHTPSGYPERQQHRLELAEDLAGPARSGLPANEGAELAETVAPALTEREFKLAEIAARGAVILDREHEREMKYLVSALSSDQIRRSV